MAQAINGQIGGKSIELSHSGCISPSTQRQTHEAWASAVSNNAKAAASKRRIALLMLRLSGGPLIQADAADNSLPGR
jgi:hypothetical protein